MAAPLSRQMRHVQLQVKQLISVHRQLRCSSSVGNSNILKLNERGLFLNVFPEEKSPELHKALISSPQCMYCGFDPTADSLHLGNLLALMGLLHCQRGGHNAIALLGGATAQIGDPSGKTKERQPMDIDVVQKNVASIRNSIDRIFTNHQKYFWGQKKELIPVKILDNAEWYAKRNVIEFLSTVGRHFRMGQMLMKQSVKSRLESPEGMNLTEFTYQAFQSYDWLHLLKKYNCRIQIGGNDQMGNIVAGYDFIGRVTNENVYALTIPLLTTSGGIKFGKSEGNAIWLNSDKTSAFHLYQYFVRLPDAEMEKYLNLFTFLSDEEIKSVLLQHKRNPESRKAQKKVAESVTKLIHGEEGLASAELCTAALYNNSVESLAQLKDHELKDLFQNATTCSLILEPGTQILDLVMKAKCFDREVDAERIVTAGGVYINHHRVNNPNRVLTPGEHILPNSLTLIRVGKKNYHIVKWV